MNREKYEAALSSFPRDTVFYEIEGGNHAGFGSYGAQDGDGEAAVFPEEQQEIAVRQIMEWMQGDVYKRQVCRLCASKYTRSKVRKALPKDFEYIIDELLHTSADDKDKQGYYEHIISTITDIGRADAFIIALASVIKRLVVDHLHVVGDVCLLYTSYT